MFLYICCSRRSVKLKMKQGCHPNIKKMWTVSVKIKKIYFFKSGLLSYCQFIRFRIFCFTLKIYIGSKECFRVPFISNSLIKIRKFLPFNVLPSTLAEY